MKKVLIIVAAAIAATFSMTSCVETTESASVTALREAKAEQYRALADMYRAQAAADSIKAAAEAAVQQALAAYHQAVADSVAQGNEQAAQEFALYLEWLKMDYQKKMLELEKDMQDKEKEIAQSANNYIKYLYNRYKNQVTKLNNLNNELFMTQVNLAEANAKLLDAQAYVAEQTALYNEKIATAKAKIEIYNNYSGVDRADLEAKYDELELNVDVLLSDMTAKGKLSDQAYQDVTDYIDDYFTLSDDFGTGYTELSTTLPLLKTIDTIGKEYATEITTAESASGGLDFIDHEKISVKDDRFDYKGNFTNQPKEISYCLYFFNPDLRETVSLDVEKDIDYFIENTLGKPKTDKEPATLLYAAVETAKTYLDNTNKDPNASPEDKAAAQKAYDEALEILAEKEAELAELEARFAKLERLLKAYDDGYAAYEKEVRAFAEGELVEAYLSACVTYEEAYDLYMENDAQMDALYDMLYDPASGGWWRTPITDGDGNHLDLDGDGIKDYSYKFVPYETSIIDVQAMIEAQEEAIADAEAKIEALGFIDDIDTDDPAENEVLAQYLIDTITANIAQLEQEIAIMQQIVDEAKAALDEALAGNDETPAE